MKQIPEVTMAFQKDIEELRRNFAVARDNFANLNIAMAQSIGVLDDLETRFNELFPKEEKKVTYKETRLGREQV